eukprot:TRINITY_DN2426_c0_g1_i1.p1 TRINITY_DN2426_c0_g1~~TRINITY_DN2426_c0_g1_i1.p1  ORF type:complete len:1142 (-),score=250.34 TRINITY_DN2426_c0_g1_i1:28-3423(-)
MAASLEFGGLELLSADLPTLVASFCSLTPGTTTQHNAALNALMIQLSRGSITLEQLVVQLESSLTSTDDALRARGTLLLSEALVRMPQLVLAPTALSTLFQFFVERLDDVACTGEVARALGAILARPAAADISNELFSKLWKNLLAREGLDPFVYKDVPVQPLQSLPFSARNPLLKVVLRILDTDTDLFLSICASCNDAAAAGVVSMCEGEKDPRNLLLVFLIISSVFAAFEHSESQLHKGKSRKYEPALFDAVSCFFPVVFSPNPDDPSAITRDQLATALLDCFGSSARIAPFSIPFLIEKLGSPLRTTQLECCAALTFLLGKYPSAAVLPFVGDLWVQTRKHLWAEPESSETVAALLALWSQTVALFDAQPQADTTPGAPASYSRPLDYLLSDLGDYATSAAVDITNLSRYKLLISWSASASETAFVLVASKLVPPLHRAFVAPAPHSSTVSASDYRLSLLALLHTLLGGLSRLAEKSPSTVDPPPLRERTHELVSEILADVAAAFLSFSGSAASVSTLHSVSPASTLPSASAAAALSTAISCLSILFTSSGPYLPFSAVSQLESFATAIVALLFAATDSSVRKECELFVGRLGANHYPLVTKNVLPVLVEHLSSDADRHAVKSAVGVLETLATSDSRLLAGAIRALVQVIEQQRVGLGVPTAPADLNVQALGRLFRSLSQASRESVDDALRLSLLLLLLRASTCQALEAAPSTALDFSAVLPPICAVAQTLSPLHQGRLYETACRIFLHGDFGSLGIHQTLQTPFAPLSTVAPASQTALLPLFFAIVASLSSPPQQLHLMFSTLLGLTRTATVTISDTTAEYARQCVAALVNKLPAEGVDNVIPRLTEPEIVLLTQQSSSADDQRAAARNLVWLTKGLLMRGHALGDALLATLQLLLRTSSHPVQLHVAAALADLFASTAGPQLSLLGTATGCQEHPLFRQKYYVKLWPALLSEMEAALTARNATQRDVYLLALLSILNSIPPQLVFQTADRALLLSVLGLSASTPLKTPALSLLELLLCRAPSAGWTAPKISDAALAEVIPALLELTQTLSRPASRALCLHVLSELAALPAHVTAAHMRTVVDALETAVDDRNRGVRQAAAQCRNAWFLPGRGHHHHEHTDSCGHSH